MYNKLSVFIAACIGMMFFGIAFIVMGSVLPDLTQKYALDSIQAASLVTFLPIGVLLGSLVFGPIVDRFGYRMLMIVSIFLTAIGLEGLSFLQDMDMLRLTIFLIGLGGGMLNGSTNALVSEISNDKDRSANLSILGACYGVGALLIPVLLRVLSRHASFESILMIFGIVIFLSIVYFVIIRFPAPLVSQRVTFKEMRGLFSQSLIITFSFFLFLQSGLEGLFNNWTTLYLTEINHSLAQQDIVLMLTFLIIGMTFMRLLLSRILGNVSTYKVLVFSILLIIVGVTGLMMANGFVFTAVSIFICGCGMAAGFPIMIGLVGSNYSHLSGTAIGFALFVALCGNSILNYLTGYLTHWLGIGLFPAALLFMLLLQLLLVVFNKRKLNIHS